MKKVFLSIILFLILGIPNLYSYQNKSNININKYANTISSKDKILINRIIFKIKILINKKGINFKNNILNKLKNIKNKQVSNSRLNIIFGELINRTKEIKIKTKQNIINSTIKDTKILESKNTYLSNYNIDFNKVKQTWLGWNNSERQLLGKYNYKYNLKLEKTAIDWSKTSKKRGNISHKRDIGDNYYDYIKITNWFKNRGVVCKNINKVTHTENIGRGNFYCNDGECTDELIKAIKRNFDFYMKEKNDTYKPHYLSIMNNYFKEIGFGITIQEKSNNNYIYYLTIHYCTQLINK